jgi:hypothetical protein
MPYPASATSSSAAATPGVIVTLGQMGTADQYREAVWQECWGQAYPMCETCWEATRQVAQAHRPGLVITHTRPPRP